MSNETYRNMRGQLDPNPPARNAQSEGQTFVKIDPHTKVRDVRALKAEEDAEQLRKEGWKPLEEITGAEDTGPRENADADAAAQRDAVLNGPSSATETDRDGQRVVGRADLNR